MEFVRGDGANHGFAIPAANWTPGGTLFFAAKRFVDDDNTDAQALIQGNWGDGVVTDITHNGVPYKRWACSFPASATNGIESGGAETLNLLGEFQFVPTSGEPVTFPGTVGRIPVVVIFDVKRKITV